MHTYLCVTVRFLDSTYHGMKSRNGDIEWPPSPLRLFQALTASASRRADGTSFSNEVVESLRFLEKCGAPTIVAPHGHAGSRFQIAVPNNDLDIPAEAWSKGQIPNKELAEMRPLKTMAPTILRDSYHVHYLWNLLNACESPLSEIVRSLDVMARGIAYFGKGIDMAIGCACMLSKGDAVKLDGQRWLPCNCDNRIELRVATARTLEALRARHNAFLHRLDDGYRKVPPLSSKSYLRVGYRSDTQPAAPRIAAFELLKLDTSGFRPFDKVKTCQVAGMLRHATAETAEKAGWNKHRIGAFVLGHGEKTREETHQPVGSERFAYIPLPSLVSKGAAANIVADIRRALIFVPESGHESEINWVRRALSGCELTDEQSHSAQAIISLIRNSDKMVQRYTKTSAVWATVTPVILPGYDDPKHYRRRIEKGVSATEQRRLLERLSDRIDRLLRKAIIQAGFSETLATHADVEWRKVGYWPGADRADRYFVPRHLRKFPAYHVRILWRDASGESITLPGPIVIGGARYSGLGLFAGTK